MKLSDYIADFLAGRGVRHVFAISGGASLHMIHSIADHPGTDFVCLQHEQACAMAADGYARARRGLAAAVATSGPGATNLLTGCAGAYYDSVPVIFLTGQVATFRLKGCTGVRQVGFQETDVVDIFRPVTKYATLVRDGGDIRKELEKACNIATSGRPGPVLVDVPDDLQRSEIDPERLPGHEPSDDPAAGVSADVGACLDMLAQAERPVLIMGWGVRLADAVEEFLGFAERASVPVLPTWAVVDAVPFDHPLLVGTFGTHGSRHGNFAVQNSDLVVAVGARLDTRAAGSPFDSFARGARRVIVDTDPCELAKFATFGLHVDLPVRADAKAFLTELLEGAPEGAECDCSEWLGRIKEWKGRYPVSPPEYADSVDVNPYALVEELSDHASAGDTFVVDTGCTLAWTLQAFRTKPGQRLIHDFNNTAMGFALPASIGACYATGGAPVTCITGDGSLQMNMQELATIIRHGLPIRVFLMNNHGYSMIRQTQDQWLGSRYLASSVEGGLAFPDWEAVAAAYGYPVRRLATAEGLAEGVREVMEHAGPIFCNVEVHPRYRVIPQVKFGRALEDMEPLLDRDELMANMLVPPYEG